MDKTVNGWSNWETWNFWVYEGDTLPYSVQQGMTLDEVKDMVYTHISFLAESEQMEELDDLSRSFATKGYDAVDTDEIAEALYDDLKDEYELT